MPSRPVCVLLTRLQVRRKPRLTLGLGDDNQSVLEAFKEETSMIGSDVSRTVEKCAAISSYLNRRRTACESDPPSRPVTTRFAIVARAISMRAKRGAVFAGHLIL